MRAKPTTITTHHLHTDTHTVEVSITYGPSPATKVLGYKAVVRRLAAAPGGAQLSEIAGCTTLNGLMREIAYALERP